MKSSVQEKTSFVLKYRSIQCAAEDPKDMAATPTGITVAIRRDFYDAPTVKRRPGPYTAAAGS